MNLLLIESSYLVSIGFHQRAAYQQGVLQHEPQGGVGIKAFGDDFAGFDARGGSVEPVGYRVGAEEGEQAFVRQNVWGLF